jgi:hypothetical protein
MKIRIYRQLHLSPFIRLTITNSGLSISFGHRGIGWITFGKRGVRETLDTPIPGVYLTENQRWNQLRPPKRK